MTCSEAQAPLFSCQGELEWGGGGALSLYGVTFTFADYLHEVGVRVQALDAISADFTTTTKGRSKHIQSFKERYLLEQKTICNFWG